MDKNQTTLKALKNLNEQIIVDENAKGKGFSNELSIHEFIANIHDSDFEEESITADHMLAVYDDEQTKEYIRNTLRVARQARKLQKKAVLRFSNLSLRKEYKESTLKECNSRKSNLYRDIIVQVNILPVLNRNKPNNYLLKHLTGSQGNDTEFNYNSLTPELKDRIKVVEQQNKEGAQ